MVPLNNLITQTNKNRLTKPTLLTKNQKNLKIGKNNYTSLISMEVITKPTKKILMIKMINHPIMKLHPKTPRNATEPSMVTTTLYSVNRSQHSKI